jgi:hypothetical protein
LVPLPRLNTSYSKSHAAGGSLNLVGSSSVYDLSDGGHWSLIVDVSGYFE